MKKVFWIGEVASQSEVAKSKATSAAASLWQSSFIQGLIDNNVEVSLLSYRMHQTWPMGPLWVGGSQSKITESKADQKYFSYLNISFIREFWIAVSIVIFSFIHKKKSSDYDCVFTYNPLIRHKLSAMFLRSLYKVKWISVLADGKVSGDPNLTIFLSFYYYNKFKYKNKYFLDGGVNVSNFNCGDRVKGVKTIIYAGSQAKLTGIYDFIEIFKKFDNKNFELLIFGKIEDKGIIELVKNDSRIKLKGFVSSEELKEECKKAYAFINPRQNSTEGNMTFPSKLLFYLQFRKPILSTNTFSLAPKYDKLLIKTDLEDLVSFKKCISYVEDLNLDKYSKEIDDFVEENSWYNLVNALVANYINKY